jgi:hypothetical protein
MLCDSKWGTDSANPLALSGLLRSCSVTQGVALGYCISRLWRSFMESDPQVPGDLDAENTECHASTARQISANLADGDWRFSVKAVAYTTTGSVDVLQDIDLPKPTPGPRDLLVEVRAISVNPVDTKIRAGGCPGIPGGAARILGWDAAGVVAAVGSEVTLFAPRDEVYYAGAIDRSGSY